MKYPKNINCLLILFPKLFLLYILDQDDQNLAKSAFTENYFYLYD